ncbi:hypothetical protein [Rhodococcus sp. 114MFTsu3.1]|uniref:hypothetical protein n=1 Tax=Rhodococcus sp. 114MFTsu3.1 TaxID=1172184 RepID=UPI00036B3752|nr:hypothetical protein [Rhodococcus sp. 114MFTsu3.1]
MKTFVRRLTVCGAVAIGAVLGPVAVASAEVTVPFQIDPAPYGNTNGSFDSPEVRCVAVLGEQPGVARITSPDDGRPGCYQVADVRWLNLSTGASGAARMSDGLDGAPREAVLRTGPGQVALVAVSSYATTVPGFATFYVP